MSKVYFGCGVMELSDTQDKMLRRSYEKPLASKLGLGSDFPRKMLHCKVSSMGVVIVAPKTAISSLSLKLYLSHRRMQSENVKMKT